MAAQSRAEDGHQMYSGRRFSISFRGYERKEIENRQFCFNAVSLVPNFK